MPLDPRIILAAAPQPQAVEPFDPLRTMGQVYQLQGLQQEQQIRALQLQDAQRKEQERRDLGAIYRRHVTTDPVTGQSTIDLPGAMTEAYRVNPVTAFTMQQAYTTTRAESRKADLEAQKAQVEQALKGLEFGGQVAQGVEDRIAAGADPQVAWQWGLETMRRAGLPTQSITPTYDANMLAGWKGQALALKDKLTAQQKVIDQQLRTREVAATEAGVPLTKARAKRGEAELKALEDVQAVEPGGKRMTEDDIADAMRQTGRSRQEVVEAAKAKGYSLPGETGAAPAAPAPTAAPAPAAAAPAAPALAPAAAPPTAPVPAPAAVATPAPAPTPVPAAAGATVPPLAPAPAPAATPPLTPAPAPAPAPAAMPAPPSPRLQGDMQRLRALEAQRARQEAHLEQLRPYATSEAGARRLQQGERELTRLNSEIDTLQQRLYEQSPESLARKKEVARAGVDVKLDEPLSTEDASRLGVGLGTTWRDIREGTTQPSRGPVPPLKGEAAKTYQLGNRMALGHGTVAQLEDRGVTGQPFLLQLEGAMDKLGSGAVATVLGLATRGAGLGALGSTAGGGALGLGIGNLASGLVNQLRSPEERLYLTAQLGFIAGILRKESGAAISAPEYLQYARIYFPQPGDDADTLAYKRQLRQSEVDALAEEFPNRPFRTAPALPAAVTRERPAGVPPGFTRETPALRQLAP